MFSESNLRNNTSIGSIEIICGPMFSGKTEELLRRLRRARYANQALVIFKPEIDTRYHPLQIVSHDANFFPSLAVKNSREIAKHAKIAEVVAIDEVQFFEDDIINVIDNLANAGKRVIVAGLDKDYQGKPFGVMPNLLAIAESITKLSAICVVCGSNAFFSFRKSADESIVYLGEKDLYEPRCRECFKKQ